MQLSSDTSKKRLCEASEHIKKTRLTTTTLPFELANSEVLRGCSRYPNWARDAKNALLESQPLLSCKLIQRSSKRDNSFREA